jgi:uncharacterized membrane protein
MPMKTLANAVTRRIRLLLIVLISAAIVHILATFTAPMMAGSTPYVRLAQTAPLHAFTVLPPVTPQSQPLPFLGPDARYAVCRYDTGRGAVAINARLPAKGWSLSLYSPEGDNTYTTLGQDGQQAVVALLLTPAADRFLGLTPEANGRVSDAQSALSLPGGRGLAVIRAPDRGLAYRRETEAILAKATCTSKPF